MLNIDVSGLRLLGCGCRCCAYQLDENLVVKTFRRYDLDFVKEVFRAHKIAEILGFGTPVHEIVTWQDGYGYIDTYVDMRGEDVVTYEEMNAFQRRINIETGIWLDDAHRKNLGYLNEKLVMFDFDIDAEEIIYHHGHLFDNSCVSGRQSVL